MRVALSWTSYQIDKAVPGLSHVVWCYVVHFGALRSAAFQVTCRALVLRQCPSWQPGPGIRAWNIPNPLRIAPYKERGVAAPRLFRSWGAPGRFLFGRWGADWAVAWRAARFFEETDATGFKVVGDRKDAQATCL